MASPQEMSLDEISKLDLTDMSSSVVREIRRGIPAIEPADNKMSPEHQKQFLNHIVFMHVLHKRLDAVYEEQKVSFIQQQEMAAKEMDAEQALKAAIEVNKQVDDANSQVISGSLSDAAKAALIASTEKLQEIIRHLEQQIEMLQEMRKDIIQKNIKEIVSYLTKDLKDIGIVVFERLESLSPDKLDECMQNLMDNAFKLFKADSNPEASFKDEFIQEFSKVFKEEGIEFAQTDLVTAADKTFGSFKKTFDEASVVDNQVELRIDTLENIKENNDELDLLFGDFLQAEYLQNKSTSETDMPSDKVRSRM